MKSLTRSNPLSARSLSPRAAALMSLATATVVQGANATWNGTTDNAWATATNWSATPVPGPGDLAIFANAGGADDTIDLGAGVTLRNLLFDSATAAAYTLGTGGAGVQTLALEGTGAVTMNATVAVNQLVNANLALGTAAGAQGFTITNNKAAASNTLTVAGGISTAQTGVKTLTTAGTGIINLSGPVTNGSGTLALAKTAAHVLTLSGNNNYSGGTTITGVLNAASSTALGTGAVTVNNAAGNQLQLGNGVNVANALTLAGGGVTAQGLLYVPTGSATYSGTIAVTGTPAAGGVFATGTGTLTIAGNNTITTANPVSVRNGLVVYSGSQNYTTGTNLLNAGAGIQFARTASMPATGSVTLSTGTTLAANVGGAGEFTLGAGTNTAGTIGGLLAGIGGQGAAVVLPAGAQIGIDTTNAAATQTWSAPFTTTNNVGLVKLGTGTLELGNGGTYTGGGLQGYPLIARQGTLLLSGGTHTANGEVVIGGTFGRSAGDAGTNARLQLDAGSLVTNNWLSIGRGNGTGGVSSDLEINNGATVTAANYSAGFNAGSALNLPKGTITLNGTSALTISGNGQINHAESPGSDMTMTLNGSSSFNATGTGIKYIGQGGTGTLTLNGTSSVNFGNAFTYVGYEAGTGVLNINGGSFNAAGELRVGGSITNGTTQNGTGTVTLTGGTATVGTLTVGRGNNNQNTVSGHVSVGTGATFTSTNDVTLGFAGNANLGRLTVDGGTFNVGPAATKWLVMSQYDSVNSQVDVSSGTLRLLNGSSIKAYGNGNGASVGQVTINHTGGDITYFSDAGATVGGAGQLDLAFSGGAAGSSTYHLDGGTLTVPSVMATSTTPTRTFNFNGGLLRAAANGTLLNLGGGNARVNVRDNGADIDTNGHNVTVVSGLDHSNIDGDAGTDGGLTKLGAGTLTMGGFSTYNGPTSVDAGTFDLTGLLASDVTVKSGAAISGTGLITGTVTLQSGSTFAASTSGVALDATGYAFSGPTTLVFSNTPTNGETYTLFTYGAGGVSGLSNLSSSFRTVIANQSANSRVVGTVTTASLAWNTTSGTWEKGIAGWSGAFTSYFNGDTVTFNERAAASTVTLNGVLTPAAVTVNNSTNPYTFTGTGSIAGEAALVKNGTGALTLATANSYTGGTTLNAGTLNLNHASALGSGPLTIAGGTLDNTSGSPVAMTGNVPQNWDANVTFTGSSSLDMGTGAVTVGGEGDTRTVTVGANTLAVGEITASSQSLVKQGAGTLEVASAGVNVNASVVFGTLDVAAGTLQINRTGATAGASGDFTAAGLTGSGTLTNGAAAERWFFNNPADGTHTFAGTLANGGTGGLGFNKNGAGTQVLSGNNSYTGTTTVAGGELVISGNNSGTGTYTAVTGGKLTLANTQALGTAALIQLSGVDLSTLDLATDTDGTAYALSMTSGTSAAIVSNRATAGTGINHTLTTQNLANGLGTGTLNFTSGANVTSGSGRVTFTQLGLGAGAAGTTTLNPTTANVTLGGVSKQNNDVSQTLGLGGTSPDNHVTGAIANGPAITTATNNVSVVKTGPSIWTLSGNSTYTGTTTVSGGTLAITGDHSAATGAVTVEAGAILAGNGDLGGAVTVNAGGIQSLAVAATPGAQATRTLGGALVHSFGSGLTLTAGVQPADGVYTLVTATGGVTFDSGTTVNLLGIANGTVTASGNNLILTVGSGGGSGFSTWASASGLTAANDDATDNPDQDGHDNGTEYILGGDPLSGSNNPKIHSILADSSADPDAVKELVLTVAVPQAAPAFAQGAPSAVSFEGFGIAVRGSTDLADFDETVIPVATILPAGVVSPTFVQGGVTYQYRSFSLLGSNGTTGKGFLQVIVTNP